MPWREVTGGKSRNQRFRYSSGRATPAAVDGGCVAPGSRALAGDLHGPPVLPRDRRRGGARCRAPGSHMDREQPARRWHVCVRIPAGRQRRPRRLQRGAARRRDNVPLPAGCRGRPHRSARGGPGPWLDEPESLSKQRLGGVAEPGRWRRPARVKRADARGRHAAAVRHRRYPVRRAGEEPGARPARPPAPRWGIPQQVECGSERTHPRRAIEVRDGRGILGADAHAPGVPPRGLGPAGAAHGRLPGAVSRR